MKSIITCQMVVDLEPEEIPGFAARVEESTRLSIQEGLAEFIKRDGPLDDEERAEFLDRFQFYGVTYSVPREVVLP